MDGRRTQPLDTNDTNDDTIVLRAAGDKATSILVQELGWVTGTSVSDGARDDESEVKCVLAGLQCPLGWCAAAVQILDHDERPAKGTQSTSTIAARLCYRAIPSLLGPRQRLFPELRSVRVGM
jgi:hypothetical protein